MTDDITGSVEEDPGSGDGLDSAAEDGLNLSPRVRGDSDQGAQPSVRRPRKRTNPLAWLVLAIVVVGVGFVVYQGLNGATLYFRNVDEAVAQRDELGTRRFRLQGSVVADANTTDGVSTFEVTFNDVTVAVRATDGLPALFEPGKPVVLEGHFAEGDELLFLADRVLVKHDETYEEENRDRLSDAEDGRSDP